ncbi:hypothetical protein [Streptomyces tardus]|uniref:hypothetical protein n=1 Tax=Streptomyces tardus TaxID=2780544 RepID=UPI001C1FFAB7|nr:hypothetical protein [Streptomyces tardus]
MREQRGPHRRADSVRDLRADRDRTTHCTIHPYDPPARRGTAHTVNEGAQK